MERIKNWLRKVRAAIGAAAVTLAAILGLYTVQAQTVTDTLTWTAPTTRIDGSAFTAADVERYTVSWGTKVGGPYTSGTQNATGLTATVQRSGTGLGTRCYIVTVTDKAGLTSAPSAEACKTVTAAPNPPTNLKVE
jgi:hypothetical protein